jgi:cell division protein FtsB
MVLELVRLRRMRLEKQANGQSDAALEKEIDYMERRIQSLEAKIAKMEKQNGD